MKIHPAGADLIYADGQTDTTKLIVAFRNFAKSALKVDLTLNSVQPFTLANHRPVLTITHKMFAKTLRTRLKITRDQN